MQNDKNFYEKISIVEKDTGRTPVSTNHRLLGASSFIETDERLFPPGSDEHIVLETGEGGQLFLEIHRIVEVDGGHGNHKEEVIEAEESKEAPRGNGRILYVDDEELLLEMGQVMMEG